MAISSGGGSEPSFVAVRTFSSHMEADIARAALTAFGIFSVASSDDCGGQRPAMTLTEGVRLMVRAEDAERANQVLNTKTRSRGKR